MLEFHRKHGKEGTIAVTRVKEPSRYGVILSKEDGQIMDFVEKPQEFIGDNINAGLYIFNKKFLNRVEAKPISIEREVFPKMAKDGELFVFQLEGFWADVGQPKDYLIGTNLYLQDLNLCHKDELAKGSNIQGNVFIVRNC
jgi:mannose-1-phosphate guanylyltransferase